MKRLVLTLLITLFASSMAFADSWYVGVDAGLSMSTITETYTPVIGGYTGQEFEDELKTTNLAAGLTIGKAYDSNWRAEAQFLYHMAATDERGGVEYEYSNWMIMLNAFYDIKLTDALFFYPMAGVGLGLETVSNNFRAVSDELDETTFFAAVQLGLGLRYMLSEDLSVDVNARYIAMSGATYSYRYNGIGYDVDSSTDAVNFTAGLKYWF